MRPTTYSISLGLWVSLWSSSSPSSIVILAIATTKSQIPSHDCTSDSPVHLYPSQPPALRCFSFPPPPRQSTVSPRRPQAPGQVACSRRISPLDQLVHKRGLGNALRPKPKGAQPAKVDAKTHDGLSTCGSRGAAVASTTSFFLLAVTQQVFTLQPTHASLCVLPLGACLSY